MLLSLGNDFTLQKNAISFNWKFQLLYRTLCNINIALLLIYRTHMCNINIALLLIYRTLCNINIALLLIYSTLCNINIALLLIYSTLCNMNIALLLIYRTLCNINIALLLIYSKTTFFIKEAAIIITHRVCNISNCIAEMI